MRYAGENADQLQLQMFWRGLQSTDTKFAPDSRASTLARSPKHYVVLSKRTLQRMNHQTTLSAPIVSKRTLLIAFKVQRP